MAIVMRQAPRNGGEVHRSGCTLRHQPTCAATQWLGEKLSSKTDLFALGLVMWLLLVGGHPYAEGKRGGRRRGMINAWIRERTVQNERRAIGEAAPDAPAALQGVIEGLLQPVEHRIATAETALAALSPLASLGGAAALAEIVQAHALRGANRPP